MANQFTLNGKWNSHRLFSEVIGLSDIEDPSLTLDQRKEIRNKTIEWSTSWNPPSTKKMWKKIKTSSLQ